MLRFLGHGPSDQLGPVCRPDDRGIVARAVADVLEDRDDWDLWIGDDVPEDAEFVRTTGGRRLARQASPIVSLDASWEDWIARRSRNLRQELRAKTRRLEREGSVRYRRTTDAERLGADLDTLIALHDDRWRARGGSRGFRGREAFHRAFAARALERGWLRLHFLEVDGRAVAALYNLRFGGSESYYQGGRSPELAPYSVGTLLHVHAISEAIRDGVREYRFLRGAEAYKQRFADRDFALESVARTNGARVAERRSAPSPAWRATRAGRGSGCPRDWRGARAPHRSGARRDRRAGAGDACDEGDVVRTAQLAWDGGTEGVWTRAPVVFADTTDDVSGFFCMALWCAMRRGEDLEVRGPVSAELLARVGHLQTVYVAWDPEMHVIEVRAPTATGRARRRDRRPAAAFFSRGVDSTFAAAQDRAGPRRRGALVFVDGLEPHHDEAVRHAEIGEAAAMAEQLELPLVVMSTNVRPLADALARDWEDVLAAGLSFAAHALAGGARAVLIPSTDSYVTHEPSGSSPLLDPLFSTERLVIEHDSIEHSRLGKVRWLAEHRPDLLEHLKVCADRTGRTTAAHAGSACTR